MTGAIVFNGAMVTMLPAFYCGAAYYLHRQFDPDTAQATIATWRASPSAHHGALADRGAACSLPGFDPARLQLLETDRRRLGACRRAMLRGPSADRVLPDRLNELYGVTDGHLLRSADAFSPSVRGAAVHHCGCRPATTAMASGRR